MLTVKRKLYKLKGNGESSDEQLSNCDISEDTGADSEIPTSPGGVTKTPSGASKKGKQSADNISPLKDINVSTKVNETLLANLSADINLQFKAINERMDNLESSLEKRIS